MSGNILISTRPVKPGGVYSGLAYAGRVRRLRSGRKS
jgi:hypothetical protein